MADIGATLSMNNAQAIKSINAFEKKAKGSFSKIEKKGSSAFARIGGAVKKLSKIIGVLLVGAIVLATKKIIDLGDNLDKMSQRVGISTAALSELKFAAEISGTTLETVEKGLKTLAKRVSDARFGLQTYVRIFEELNVEYVDAAGNLRDIDKVFEDSIRAISGLRSETEKAALAQELFGRAGTQLLPLMKLGEEGLDALKERARELGIVFSTESAKASADFVDALTELKGALFGLTRPVLEPVIKGLTKLAESITSVAVVTRRAVNALGDFLGMKRRLEGFEDLQSKVRGRITPEEGLATTDTKEIDSIFKSIESRRSLLNEILIKLRFDEFDQAIKFAFLEKEARKEAIEGEITDLMDKNALTLELDQQLKDQLAQNESVFNEKLAKINDKRLKNEVKQEKDKSQIINKMRQGVANNAIGLLQTIAGENKAAAIAIIAIEKGLAIALTIQNTAAAIMSAMKLDPTGILAARVATLGQIQVGIIAATGLAQAANVGSGSSGAGGGSGSTGFGSPTSIVDVTPVTEEEQELTIILNINGEQVAESLEKISRHGRKINIELAD